MPAPGGKTDVLRDSQAGIAPVFVPTHGGFLLKYFEKGKNQALDKQKSCDGQETDVWLAFDSVVDVMFIIDLWIQFFFTYTNEFLGITVG